MNIEIIDCHYFRDKVAASFLLYDPDKKEAAFIENNTSKAVPYLLEALEQKQLSPENVKYIIITHVHLDHSGGTAALLEKCPNAMVVAHPRAVRHLVHPERLVTSAKMVYGEDVFNELYGDILPVAEERIIAVKDNTVLNVGSRELTFLHTEGHAKHHICIYDDYSNAIFTGDTFGIAYPELQTQDKKFLFPSSSPTDFSSQEALDSLDKIKKTHADKAFLTHFGLWEDMQNGFEQMKHGLLIYEKIIQEALEFSDNEKREKFCNQKMHEYMKGKINDNGLNESLLDLIDVDMKMNAMGLSFVAQRQLKKIRR